MKYTYEETINFDDTKSIVATHENGFVLFIPADLANSDYQAYLEHEAKTK